MSGKQMSVEEDIERSQIDELQTAELNTDIGLGSFHSELNYSPEQIRFMEEYRSRVPEDICCKMDLDMSLTQEISEEEKAELLKNPVPFSRPVQRTEEILLPRIDTKILKQPKFKVRPKIKRKKVKNDNAFKDGFSGFCLRHIFIFQLVIFLLAASLGLLLGALI
jgi:hypothetical protein